MCLATLLAYPCYLTANHSGGGRSIHRADLQKTLLERLNENTHLHLSSRVVAFEEHDDGVTLTFQDGRTAGADLVVGADGLRSIIRRSLITAKFPGEKDRIDPIWSGSIAYRSIIPAETLMQRAPNHPAIVAPFMVSLFYQA